MNLEALAALGGEGEILPEIDYDAMSDLPETEMEETGEDMDGYDVPFGEWAEVVGE
jgi:hypothetical protein